MVQLTDEQMKQLDQAANREGTSRSAIIRRAVNRFLEVEQVDVMEKAWVKGLRRSQPDSSLDHWSQFWSEWNLRHLAEEEPW